MRTIAVARPLVAPLAAALCLATLSCADASRSTGPGDERVEVADGDGQRGAPRQELPHPVRVRVTSGGVPLAGVRVQWQVEGGGHAEPAESLTDAGGFAETRWTLGDAPAAQRIRAVVSGITPATVRALFEGDPPPLNGPPVPLAFVTFDGSGEVVHTDWTATPSRWASAGWLALTPYPNGNATFENPSLYAGEAISSWLVPGGLTNPVVRPRGSGYLSDPDVLYRADRDEMWLYYREVAAGRNTIFLTRSGDGVHWSTPVTVADGPDHVIVSPAVVRHGASEWLMWSVNSGSAGCGAAATTVELRRSSDGVSWSSPQPVVLEQDGFSPWHIEVQWIAERGEYWALYNGKTPGGCLTPALFLATSADGVSWRTYPSPVLARDAIPEFEHTVYRSTFAYDDATDRVTFWYTGARYLGGRWIWSAAVQEVERATLFARMNGASLEHGDLRSQPAVPAWEHWP